MNITHITDNYIEAALWSSVDDQGEPLDSNYFASDIHPDTLKTMRDDVSDFVTSNEEMLIESGQSDEQIGHDFWFTRNHHGAGFWDRGLGAVGDRLTDAAHMYGSVDLYVGDDGVIYS